jgi:hypothetical protein
MNLTSALMAMAIISMGTLTVLKVADTSFRISTTSQVKTDVDTYVFNAKTTPASPECVQNSGFCYLHDTSDSSGKLYMVFKITKGVFGPSVIQRLKPIIPTPTQSPTKSPCDGDHDQDNDDSGRDR